MTDGDQTPLPAVHVLGLGGTIAMTGDAADGVTPGLGVDQLVTAVPQLEALARVSTESLSSVPSAAMRLDDVVRIVRAADAAVAAGCRGVVVVQGTDVLEESSFLADLLHHHAAPLVFTGAMRHPQQPGADGPANILAAVAAAASDQARDVGALVCMNGELHAARFVQKRHPFGLGAFASPSMGPLGWVVEGRVRIHARPGAGTRFTVDGLRTPLPRVALHRCTLDDDPTVLDAVAALPIDGLVVEGFGAGHVPPWTVGTLERLAARIPVVLASRTSSGEGLTGTYGFDGSETDLLRRGLLWAGALDGLKARLLLTACLASGRSRSESVDDFASWSH